MGNAATRLERILTAVSTSPEDPKTRAFKVWASILQVDAPPTDLHETDEVARRLGLLGSQVDSLEAHTLDWADPAYFRRHLMAVRKVFDARLLNHRWETVKKRVNDGSEGVIGTLARSLPSEPEPDQQALANLRERAEGLRTKVRDSGLPADLSLVLEKQLDWFQQGIDDWELQGEGAIEAAARNASGALLIHREDLRGFEQHDVVKEVNALWQDLLKLGRFGLLVGEIAGLLLVAPQLADAIRDSRAITAGSTPVEAPAEIPAGAHHPSLLPGPPREEEEHGQPPEGED